MATRINFGILSLSLLILFSACGTKTGNGLVTIQSDSFNANQLVSFLTNYSTALNRLQICVTQIKLETSDGNNVKENGSDALEFKAGLVDLSAGSSVTWGSTQMPVDFTIQRVYVEAHHDPQSCSNAAFSINFNSILSTDDIEFKWKFPAPVVVRAGDTLKLSMAAIVTALRQGATNGTINSQNLKDTCEGQEDSARD